MSRTRTREQIRDQALILADAVGDEHATGAANVYVNALIDQSAALLQDMLAARDPDRYLVRATITTTAGTLEYTLPAAFKKIVRVDWRPTSGARYRLEPYEITDMHEGDVLTDAYPMQARYRVLYSGTDGTGVRLVFDRQPPLPTVEVWYVAAPTVFASDAATIDGVSGWESWIVWDVVASLQIRAQEDPSAAMAERARIEAQIKASASSRDAGRPKRVSDTRRGGQSRIPRFW